MIALEGDVIGTLAALLASLPAIAWRRRRAAKGAVSQQTPHLGIHGHDRATIERSLLSPLPQLEAVSMHRLDLFALDSGLLAYFGKNCLDRTQDAVRRLSQWQLDTSWDPRQRMVREALTCAGQMIPFTDGKLPRAIASDVGVASIQHAMACHNLLVWLRSPSDQSAHEAFLAALETSPLRPATPADMLAGRSLTEPLIFLLKQAACLEEYLLSPRNGPEQQRAAARTDLGEQIQRIRFVLHLHELEAGDLHSLLPSLLSTDAQKAVEDVWRAHTHVEARTRRRPIEAVDISYHWYVKTGQGRRHLKPLRTVIEEICPKQFAALHRGGTGPSTFEAAVAHLIARNPLDLISRLPTFPWREYQMRPQALPAHVKLSWEELAPLLSERYWVLHDKLAASLAHSLCRLVSGNGNEFEGMYLKPFLAKVAELPWDDSTEEAYWGARHLLVSWCEHLLRRNDFGLGLDREAKNSDVRLLDSLLLSFHRLRMEFDRRAHLDQVTAWEQHFRKRYARFRQGPEPVQGAGDEAKMIRLCVEWAGAFYPGRPQTVVTWPPTSADGNARRRGPGEPAAGYRRPLILESYAWGDPHSYFRELVEARKGWDKDGRDPNSYMFDLVQGMKVRLHLGDMIFEVPPQLSQHAALFTRLEDELCELAFRAYAKCMEQSYGMRLHDQPAQARIVGEGRVTDVLIRVRFDWHHRIWWSNQPPAMVDLDQNRQDGEQ